MEDQQPASGDLTAAPAEEGTAPTEEGTAPAEEGTAPDDEADAATPDDEVPPVAPQPKAPPRNRTKKLVVAAVLTFVLAGAAAAAAVEPYLVSRATVVTKLAIAKTAAEAINTLWTYTPEDMDTLPDRAAKFLSGDFEDQYRKFVDAIAATNKQAQVSNSTQVVAAAVESLTGDEATALVYTNTTSTTPQAAIPSMKYVSYRLQLKRQGTRWLVTKMTTVTSLDLTPKL